MFCVIYWLELSAHIFNVFRAGGGGRHVVPGAGGREVVAPCPWRQAGVEETAMLFFYSYRVILLTI